MNAATDLQVLPARLADLDRVVQIRKAAILALAPHQMIPEDAATWANRKNKMTTPWDSPDGFRIVGRGADG